jgi:hypothetical protein
MNSIPQVRIHNDLIIEWASLRNVASKCKTYHNFLLLPNEEQQARLIQQIKCVRKLNLCHSVTHLTCHLIYVGMCDLEPMDVSPTYIAMAALLLASKMIIDPYTTHSVNVQIPVEAPVVQIVKKTEWLLFQKAQFELFTPTVTTFGHAILNNTHIIHNSTLPRARMRKDINSWFYFIADLALTMPSIQLHDAHVIAYSILMVVCHICGAEHSFSCEAMDIPQRQFTQCKSLLLREIGRGILRNACRLVVEPIEQQQIEKLRLLLLEEQKKEQAVMDVA